MQETVSQVSLPVNSAPQKHVLKYFFTFIAGISAIVVPFASTKYVQMFGMSDLTIFNSSMLLILTVLLMVFVVINCFSCLFNNNFKRFSFGLVILLCALISFMWNLVIYLGF